MFLKSVARRILPYRLYFLLFELQEQLAQIRAALRRSQQRCRDLARYTMQHKTGRDHYPGGSGALRLHELSVFSQNGEDGILLYLFSIVGTTNKVFVEFGVEDGRECNSANLLINFGWSGLLMDGSEDNVTRGLQYYKAVLGTECPRLTFKQAFITAENVNDLIQESAIEGEIDLLCIDIDGNDYWVWAAIDCLQPRVVVVEYNASFGPTRRVTVPYKADFVWNSRAVPELFFTGASLALLAALAEDKGYTLVGCESRGVNAFFVRNDLAEGRLPAVSVAEAFRPHAARSVRFTQVEQERAAQTLQLVEV